MTEPVFTGFPVRRWIVVLGVILIAGGLTARAVDLKLNHQEFLQRQGDARHLRVVSIPAHRGMILDRNGEPIAVSTPVESIWVSPKELRGSRKRWPVLERKLRLEKGTIAQIVESRGRREFVYLRRHVDPETAAAVGALEIRGVYLQREYRRYYPLAEVAGHVLGFTNVDDAGQEGIELAFDELMVGKPGAKRVLRDRLGRVVENVESLRTAQPGRDLTLSIDRRIQFQAYRALLDGVKAYRARGGSAVVMDPRTGEVLAMVNQPSFNPNNRGDRVSRRFRNRAVTDLVEPGSTAKPFTVAAALQAGIVEPSSRIDTTPGYFAIGKYTVRDHRNYGILDVSGILKKSSNVGASKLALQLKPKDLWQILSGVGFGAGSGSYFPGEAQGVLNDFIEWRDVNRVTLSFGYGLSVTALQLARAYSVFANGGVLPEATFLKVEGEVGGTRVLAAPVAAQVARMLETVVGPGGTGGRARVAGYRVGGKTGTAKKSIIGGYADDRYLALFAGMAPMSDPRLVIVVTIDEPAGKEYYGGRIAAPVFAAIAQGALRVLGVAPDDPSVVRGASRLVSAGSGPTREGAM